MCLILPRTVQGKHKSASFSLDFWFVLNCKGSVCVCVCLNTVKSKSLCSIYFPLSHIFQKQSLKDTAGTQIDTHILSLQMEVYCGSVKISAITCLKTIDEVSSQGFAQVHFSGRCKKKTNKQTNMVIVSIQWFYATLQRHLLLSVKRKTLHTEADALWLS